MLLTDQEFLKLGPILRIIADILGEGFKGREGFTKKAEEYIQFTDIKIETVLKVTARLELF